MTQKITLLLLICCGFFVNMNAQEAPAADAEEFGVIKVLGDIDKGMFRMNFELPTPAKKMIWTVHLENGELYVKEKFKKMDAGKHHYDYNIRYAPKGILTFTLTSDDKVVAIRRFKKG